MPSSTFEIIQIEGHELAITNPEKLLWPDCGITKLHYLERLITLSPYLLPYCRNRYLTTIRYPGGIQGKSFFQKNAPKPVPDFVHTAILNDVNYVNANSLSTLVWLGNLACLEFHPSFHYIGSELPAEWFIDLDPTLEDDSRIGYAAYVVGEALASIGISAIPKTSGATGIQIYVPIQSGYTFEQLRALGHFLAQYMTQKYPDLFTIERLKKNRGACIYFDYLQHAYGKTLSAPYTPRARPNAPVSTPLTWEECKMGVHPADYNLFTIEDRIAKYGDLISQLPAQSLDQALQILE